MVDVILGHNAEAIWVGLRLFAVALVVWELADAIIDLRVQVRNNNDRLLMRLAMWRLAHDVFVVLVAVSWFGLLLTAYGRPHGAYVDYVLKAQNALVLLLIGKTIYLRHIRILIQREVHHARGGR